MRWTPKRKGDSKDGSESERRLEGCVVVSPLHLVLRADFGGRRVRGVRWVMVRDRKVAEDKGQRYGQGERVMARVMEMSRSKRERSQRG